MPDDADPLQLAMLKVNPATAWMMLKDYVRLEPGDWLIQDAANSGVGKALIRLARDEGLRSVNVVRRPEPAKGLQALGADVVLVDGEDLAERVAEATKGASVRLGIDAVGGGQVTRLADCLAEGGTVVNYGLLSGEPCRIRSDQLIFKGITLTGFWLQKTLTAMARTELERLYRALAETCVIRRACRRCRGDLSDRADRGGRRARRPRPSRGQDPGPSQWSGDTLNRG